MRADRLLPLGGGVLFATSLVLIASLLPGALSSGAALDVSAMVFESGWVCTLALGLALPPALLAAVHTNEFASEHERELLRSCFTLLAGVPSVVFAFLGLELLAPAFGLGPEQAVLTASLTLAAMLVPSLALGGATVLAGIPLSLREAAWALGAGRAQTVVMLVLPGAVPGLLGVVLLALARALGELVIVALVLGPGAQTLTLAGFIAHAPRAAAGAGSSGLFVIAGLLVCCTALLGIGARRLSTIQRQRGGEW